MLIVCLYTYVYMYIRAKKANSTGEGNLAQAGGGFGLKQLSMLDTLKNRWTRGRKGPYPLSCTCMYNIAENNIRNETMAVHIYARLQKSITYLRSGHQPFPLVSGVFR